MSSPDKKAPTRILAHKGKLYASASNGIFRYWDEIPDTVAVTIPEKHEPSFTWEGGLIPFGLWAEIVSFMKWTQKEFKAEAHCTLFYHRERKEWAAWAFPQKTYGMTVSLDTQDPQYKEDRKRFGDGWIMAGSIHHHCSSKAFQSSTDSTDEMDKEGVHFTIGEVLDSVVDIHCRKVLNGKMHECNVSEFVDPPAWFKAIPRELQGNMEVTDAYAAVTEVPFPDEWKTRITKPSFNQASSSSGNTGRMSLRGRAGVTEVGGNDSRTPGYLRTEAELKAIKEQVPNMEKMLDSWAMTVANEYGLDVKDMAKLWLMSECDAVDQLNAYDLAIYRKINAQYQNLTLSKIKIPLLFIIDHMRSLAK